MNVEGEESGGILSSARRALRGSVELLHTRLELFGIELREEQYRLVEALLLAAGLIGVAMVTVTLITLLVVVAFWESGRLIALGSLIVIYLGAGTLLWSRLQSRLKSGAPFSGTLNELKKDCECFNKSGS